jgi:hypothetical protein
MRATIAERRNTTLEATMPTLEELRAASTERLNHLPLLYAAPVRARPCQPLGRRRDPVANGRPRQPHPRNTRQRTEQLSDPRLVRPASPLRPLRLALDPAPATSGRPTRVRAGRARLVADVEDGRERRSCLEHCQRVRRRNADARVDLQPCRGHVARPIVARSLERRDRRTASGRADLCRLPDRPAGSRQLAGVAEHVESVRAQVTA